jgi:hypothetical protein
MMVVYWSHIEDEKGKTTKIYSEMNLQVLQV